MLGFEGNLSLYFILLTSIEIAYKKWCVHQKYTNFKNKRLVPDLQCTGLFKC